LNNRSGVVTTGERYIEGKYENGLYLLSLSRSAGPKSRARPWSYRICLVTSSYWSNVLLNSVCCSWICSSEAWTAVCDVCAAVTLLYKKFICERYYERKRKHPLQVQLTFSLFSIRVRSQTATSFAIRVNSFVWTSSSEFHFVKISSMDFPRSIEGGGPGAGPAVVLVEVAGALLPATAVRAVVAT
jgi:hypothetical protein